MAGGNCCLNGAWLALPPVVEGLLAPLGCTLSLHPEAETAEQGWGSLAGFLPALESAWMSGDLVSRM